MMSMAYIYDTHFIAQSTDNIHMYVHMHTYTCIYILLCLKTIESYFEINLLVEFSGVGLAS